MDAKLACGWGGSEQAMIVVEDGNAKPPDLAIYAGQRDSAKIEDRVMWSRLGINDQRLPSSYHARRPSPAAATTPCSR